jgi:quercetin dioxygenase-like cupin family protein
MTHNHKDKRGIIKDLLIGVDIDAVTYVTFNKGALRGNHYHKDTIQYDYLLEGQLKMATDKGIEIIKENTLIVHPKGVPHAYKALKKSILITMTKGVRKGTDYSLDTYKLDEPLL